MHNSPRGYLGLNPVQGKVLHALSINLRQCQFPEPWLQVLLDNELIGLIRAMFESPSLTGIKPLCGVVFEEWSLGDWLNRGRGFRLL